VTELEVEERASELEAARSTGGQTLNDFFVKRGRVERKREQKNQ
jgi:hypothetical protein